MPNLDSNELSERELDILKLVATGAGNKEIALKLFISSNTVKVHLRNIFTKIGVTSRTEAAMYAVRTGLVINPAIQVVGEENKDNVSRINGYATDTMHLPGSEQLAVPANRKVPRWTTYLLLIIILGVIFLGWRLSPGTALLSNPTTTNLPPQNTITPIPHWNQLSSLPSARSNLALLSFGNQIYAIGGLASSGVVSKLDRFDPQTNTWVTLAPKLSPVFDARAAVINGLIYIPGGRLSIQDMQPSDTLEIYDTNTNQWSSGAPLPIPLSGYGLVAYEGYLYVFGGWDGQKYRDNVFSYDPKVGFHIIGEYEINTSNNLSWGFGIKYYNVTYDLKSAKSNGVNIPLNFMPNEIKNETEELDGSGVDLSVFIAVGL